MVWRVLWEFVVAVLVVDFYSGLLHWFEDQYGSEKMHPWIVKHVVTPNRLHHIYPRKVAHCPHWISAAQGVGPAILFFPLNFVLLGWRMGAMASVLAAMANFVHKWNHQREWERPRLVNVLQSFHILQSPEQHYKHHISPTDIAYCVVTPFLNPILDKIGLWRRLESLIFLITGVPANSPEEPQRYYRVDAGRILEYQFDKNTWVEWPDYERYQRPVR